MLPSPRPSGCAQGQHPDLGQNLPWVQTAENKLEDTTRETSPPSCKVCGLEEGLKRGVCLHLIAAMSVPYPGPDPQTQ